MAQTAKEAVTTWRVTMETIQSLAELNHFVIEAWAKQSGKDDPFLRYRIGNALTPDSVSHLTRMGSLRSSDVDTLGLDDLNTKPLEIDVPAALIQALGLSEAA